MIGPIKLTPLYSKALENNAHFIDQNGWRIPKIYSSVEAEIAVIINGVGLVDDGPNGKLLVEGLRAEEKLQRMFGRIPTTIGSGIMLEGKNLYRLRLDRFFIVTLPEGERIVLERLVEMGELFDFMVTDITHGRAEIRIVGPACWDLMSKLCGLDFHVSMGSNFTARQTSLAKTAQLIIRRDLGPYPSFSIIGARSLGSYIWDTLLEAGREWDILPVGRAALDSLLAS